MGISTRESEDQPDEVLLSEALSEGSNKTAKKISSKKKNRGFFVVEDILGHLMFVTWNLEEARQLAATMVLSGKVQRNLIAVRRVTRDLVQAPSTESGDSPKGPAKRIKITNNSGQAPGLTLGFYIEKHYNSSKVDLSTVRRVRMGDHLATLASSKRSLDILGIRDGRGICEQIIALWHPVSELADGDERTEYLGTRILNCDRKLVSLRYGLRQRGS